ncbi:hypothetical protein [Schnuerera ultunensis]|uniref:hypothetical protein n=1 Tax=Schnuerera ultunensis TaxID=45497 RepID=UPI00046EA79E|nr:hypothetical protein [Schnuerera ultunensis]
MKNFDFTTEHSVNIVLNIECTKPFWVSIEKDKIETCIFLFVASYYVYYYIFQYFQEGRYDFYKRDFKRKMILILILIISISILSFILSIEGIKSSLFQGVKSIYNLIFYLFTS